MDSFDNAASPLYNDNRSSGMKLEMRFTRGCSLWNLEIRCKSCKHKRLCTVVRLLHHLYSGALPYYAIKYFNRKINTLQLMRKQYVIRLHIFPPECTFHSWWCLFQFFQHADFIPLPLNIFINAQRLRTFQFPFWGNCFSTVNSKCRAHAMTTPHHHASAVYLFV